MNILLTGATGNIGQHLIPKLTKGGYSIICQSRKVKDVSQKSGTWVQHDLSKNNWNIIDNYKIDIVIHLAAQTSAYKSNIDPLNHLLSNVVAPLKLIDYFKNKYPVPPFFINVSTATVAGMTEKMPINESVEVSPITFYDLSKLTMESYLDQCIRHGFIKGCSLRLANVYGVSLSSGIKDRSILDRIYQAAKNGDELMIMGSGNYIRDYVHIEDVTDAILAAVEKRKRINFKRFYIGSGEGTTVKNAFSKVAAKALRIPFENIKFKYVEWPENSLEIEKRNCIIDHSEFTKLTGWRPKISFEQGVANYGA